MQRKTFVFNIEAEHNNSVLIKLLTAIVRRRMLLISFASQIKQNEEVLDISFVTEETGENVDKFFKQLDKQVDILSVCFFELDMKNDHVKLPSITPSSVYLELSVH